MQGFAQQVNQMCGLCAEELWKPFLYMQPQMGA